MSEKTVQDIMLPLTEYAIVDGDATLAEALFALDDAQTLLAPGRHPHRAVLVRSSKGEITGKLGHLAFLRALLPERQAWESEELLVRAGVSKDMRSMSDGIWEFLADDMLNVDEKVHHVKVKDVCSPTSATIRDNATLTEAIREFSHHCILSLLVTREDRVVGVLRLADLFDEIADGVRRTRRLDNEKAE